MAYFNQEMKAQKAASIKALAKEYGVSLSLKVVNHSKFVANIKSGAVDFFGEMNDSAYHNPAYTKEKRYIESINYGVENGFINSKAREFLIKLRTIMMQGNHDNSDSMTDYFDVGWYIGINIGDYGKPYEMTA